MVNAHQIFTIIIRMPFLTYAEMKINGGIKKLVQTRMMFIKHYAPNRCLCIKVAKSTMFN